MARLRSPLLAAHESRHPTSQRCAYSGGRVQESVDRPRGSGRSRKHGARPIPLSAGMTPWSEVTLDRAEDESTGAQRYDLVVKIVRGEFERLADVFLLQLRVF